MLTQRQIIFNIGNPPRGGNQSDDEPLSDREKAFIIDGVRAMLIQQDLDKDRAVDRQMEQTLNCVELIRVPMYECCGIHSDCHVLRTKNKIPKFISSTSISPRPTYIGGVSGFEEFQYLESHRVRWTFLNPMVGSMRWASIINDYIYVFNDRELERIQLRGFFETPTDAGNWGETTSNSCINWDSPYPMPMRTLPTLKQRIWAIDIAVMLKGMPDEVNNANGNPLVK